MSENSAKVWLGAFNLITTIAVAIKEVAIATIEANKTSNNNSSEKE
jgi:hypothetical protein